MSILEAPLIQGMDSLRHQILANAGSLYPGTARQDFAILLEWKPEEGYKALLMRPAEPNELEVNPPISEAVALGVMCPTAEHALTALLLTLAQASGADERYRMPSEVRVMQYGVIQTD